jgi:hypothetical protein
MASISDQNLLLLSNLRAGMSPAEARRQAVLKLGAAEAIREDHHAEQSLELPVFHAETLEEVLSTSLSVRLPDTTKYSFYWVFGVIKAF